MSDSIWILAPDSSNTCCDCGGRLSPCDPCASCNASLAFPFDLFGSDPFNPLSSQISQTGSSSLVASSVISVTGGQCKFFYGTYLNQYTAFGDCGTCNSLGSNFFSTKFVDGTTNNRSFLSDPVASAGAADTPICIIDGLNNVVVEVDLFEPATASNSVAPGPYNFRGVYTLSSSTAGFNFVNTNTQINTPNPNCSRTIYPSVPPVSIPFLVANFNSGDIVNFSMTSSAVNSCFEDFGAEFIIWTDSSVCSPASIFNMISLNRLNTGTYTWFTFNGQNYQNQIAYLADQAYNNSGSSIVNGVFNATQPDGIAAIQQICSSNFYSSNNGASCNFGSAPFCVDSFNQSCCPIDTSNTLVKGTSNFSVKFDTNECVQMNFSTNSNLKITATDFKGNLIDIVASRLLAINLSTGNYNLCAELP